ncbi:MAG: glucose-6-phosphate dehydrogenase [bacterium]|nr:glucose-6-phosphate dehydrogenase [bacterium]
MIQETIPSFIMVIYGATGDLTKRKLIPALFALYKMHLLPREFTILAFARREYDSLSFAQTLKEFIANESKEWDAFSSHIKYVRGNFDSVESFKHLKEAIRQYESEMGECLSKLYYMATSPDVLPEIIDHIGEVGLHIGCGEEGKWTRIIIEKPFGQDLDSAIALNTHLKKFFIEEQIYRIDHYLGKETVQNILATRFTNIMLGPVWNKEYIQSIEVIASEELGVEGRGGYYDTAGALRDMVQSHLLQLLALTTMDEPEQYDANAIRDKKNEILEALRPITKETVVSNTSRGQYAGYTQEEKVRSDSKTETFVQLKTFIDLPQWQDVPMIIRTGKKLNGRYSEIRIKFKHAEAKVFSNLFCELRSNVLVIRVQPNEGINLKMLIKEPGFGMKLQDVFLNYEYTETYQNLPDAYERLLMDSLLGDQSLFTRTDEIESSWRFVTNILKLWSETEVPLHIYEAGTSLAI